MHPDRGPAGSKRPSSHAQHIMCATVAAACVRRPIWLWSTAAATTTISEVRPRQAALPGMNYTPHSAGVLSNVIRPSCVGRGSWPSPAAREAMRISFRGLLALPRKARQGRYAALSSLGDLVDVLHDLVLQHGEEALRPLRAGRRNGGLFPRQCCRVARRGLDALRPALHRVHAAHREALERRVVGQLLHKHLIGQVHGHAREEGHDCRRSSRRADVARVEARLHTHR
mmetsp:Transcript_95852/g.266176  ORF Transcript_95852/g.266176 Transcript_95852/m.266176 type:complete len:228 (-) Transcript_95852:84-767(-)